MACCRLKTVWVVSSYFACLSALSILYLPISYLCNKLCSFCLSAHHEIPAIEGGDEVPAIEGGDEVPAIEGGDEV